MPMPGLPALPPTRSRAGLWNVRSDLLLPAVARLLATNELFRRCGRGDLDYLAATAQPMRFEPGDLLCIEGTWAPVCYAVAEGCATVSIGGAAVGSVGPLDVVGERGILLDSLRAATVVATTPMTAFAIPRTRLEALLADSRSLREWMLGVVRRHYPSPN